MLKKQPKLVYSTRTGDERKTAPAPSGPAQSAPPARQTIKVMRERSGRKGKTVTVASGFELTTDELAALAKLLKNLCGAGGTSKIEAGLQTVEIQGDHRDKVVEKLKALGYKAKPAGG